MKYVRRIRIVAFSIRVGRRKLSTWPFRIYSGNFLCGLNSGKVWVLVSLAYISSSFPVPA